MNLSESTKGKRVAIFGGGIGGLSTAHYLSKLGYVVDVYETKDALGGLARSERDSDGCATEYCWRVYFSFYDNFLQVLSEIPTHIEDKDGDKNKQGCAKDQLVVYEHANLMTPLSLKDKILGYYNILSGVTACDERLDSMDDLSWWNALGSTSSSNLFRTIGPWLGMDRRMGSYRSVIKVGIEQQIIPSYLSAYNLGTNYQDYVTSKPTSEAIFIPWRRHLESSKVRFHFGEAGTLSSLRSIDGEIRYATLANGAKIEADYFVLSIPVEVLERVIINSPSIDGDRIRLGAISKLKDTCLHTQLSLQLYFNRPISLGGKNAFLLVESQWDLIILSYDQAYIDTELCTSLPEAKGGWSVAATTAYIPGLNGKTLLECNEEEIKSEIWSQLVSNKYLQTLIEENNGFNLNSSLVVKWSPLWPTFFSDEGKLTTTEPKFTNNAGSYKLRPSLKTYIPNLFIATAYIKETIDIFSMEAACIAGKRVAHAIDPSSPDATIRPRPLIFVPFRTIDTVFWKAGLPNPILLVVIVLIYILYRSGQRLLK